MQFNFLNFKTLLLLVSFSLFITGCATQSELRIDTETKNTPNDDNFTLEGKFKVSYDDSKESGYFIIKKSYDLIQLKVGKNYLLPESEFFFYVNELINIKDLFKKLTDRELKSYPEIKIPVSLFIQILTRSVISEPLGWKIQYQNNSLVKNNLKAPRNIKISKDGLYLKIINKRLY
jgi:outer membrane biogenesis lipoprotein LolB|tara:strand:- start:287 stop:814 length:528 start_codon:yes stop_codon:yes gene_type:complete